MHRDYRPWLTTVVASTSLWFAPAARAESPVNDLTQTVITLERSACYGSCPVYRVTIEGNGQVSFTTDTAPVDGVDAVHREYQPATGVLVGGFHSDKVSTEQVASLVAKFEKAKFWGLKDTYRATVTDSPTYIVTLQAGDRKKVVVDYVGESAGMPAVVTQLEEAIDRVAGTDRWVRGTPALLPWLEKTGFDFHSADAARIAVMGERRDASEELVLALVARGAPLDAVVEDPGNFFLARSTKEVAGMSLIQSAMRRGHAPLFNRLRKLGWLDRWGKDKAALVFAEDAAGCSPALVDAVAAAGVAIDAATPLGKSRYEFEAGGVTALGAMADSYSCGRPGNDAEDRRVATAAALLAHGANPNHKDGNGRTTLYGVESLALLNLLLDHGADATIKAKDGSSVIYGSWSDDVVVRLLEAGASIKGHYFGGTTLAKQMKEQPMPKVAAWLAQHPEVVKR